MNFSRRSFIVGVSTVATVALLDRLPGRESMGAGSTYDQLLGRVFEALNHRSPGTMPGSDAERIRPLLARILHTAPHELDSYPEVSSVALRQRIQDNIASDYAQRRLQVIDGWWLSDTEAGCLELLERVA